MNNEFNNRRSKIKICVVPQFDLLVSDLFIASNQKFTMEKKIRDWESEEGK